ncbi:MAG TPA: NUDIX hydrolase [Marinilabiliales bacterium]|nr:MAG: hypothetical protein A2W96_12910 [Bacteroidetes bacterium GWD2_40_43]OFX92969.1 MAG: hypothetical protein A2W97_05165 [Bacteroidetes bacterium GWE2_40_63]OFY21338.1 MAG: hypothetical protein A2W88_09160 [Bacteroidetes bacterium GWF2_40_13]OFZ30966.1 MAG: hypothetical protein A2437_15175 [Bacteroidetes bacterium RIFOXYC2_FULL_40_12]HAM98280.1 NUDIX hydrolase [Marinilabiliales bacterium]
MSYTYEYPRPMVTTDIVLFRQNDKKVEVLLIKRLNPPYQDHWALPGGFVDKDESLLHAATRELSEETHMENIELKQLYTFGDPGRDPRGHCVTVVYWGWVTNYHPDAFAGDDAKEAQWFPIDELPPVAFDHELIVSMAIKKALG